MDETTRSMLAEVLRESLWAGVGMSLRVEVSQLELLPLHNRHLLSCNWYRGLFPAHENVRYVHDRPAGLSRARNSGSSL